MIVIAVSAWRTTSASPPTSAATPECGRHCLERNDAKGLVQTGKGRDIRDSKQSIASGIRNEAGEKACGATPRSIASCRLAFRLSPVPATTSFTPVAWRVSAALPARADGPLSPGRPGRRKTQSIRRGERTRREMPTGFEIRRARRRSGIDAVGDHVDLVRRAISAVPTSRAMKCEQQMIRQASYAIHHSVLLIAAERSRRCGRGICHTRSRELSPGAGTCTPASARLRKPDAASRGRGAGQTARPRR